MTLPLPPMRLGIDLGGTKLEAVLFDAKAQAVWRQRQPTPAGDYKATVAAISAAVQEARRHTAGAGLSVGMGTPGTLTHDGRMKNCNSTCLNGQPLLADVQAAIGQPVRIANDANCMALSEATDGAAAGADVVFGVILGTGTGAGIVVGGRVLTGANGLAGEWGHNPLPWGQPGEDPQYDCYCGQTGCVETLLSGPGLAREHAALNGANTGAQADAATIAQRAAAGDAACQATLQRHSTRLARALAAVINLLDPDVIVLGGGLSAMQHLYTEVPERWSRWVLSAGISADIPAGSREPVRTRLVPPLHGDATGVRGAAWLWPGS